MVGQDKVELTVLVPDDEEGFLMKELMEGTNGQAMTEKTEQCWFCLLYTSRCV